MAKARRNQNSSNDTIDSLIARLAALETKPAAQFYLSANFSSNATTPVNFDVVEFDFLGNVTTSPTAWKFTVGAGQGGLYLVHAQGKFATSALYTFDVYKNGVLYRSVGGNDTSTSTIPGSTLIQLNPGDYIDFRTSSSVSVTGGAPVAGTFRTHGFIRKV